MSNKLQIFMHERFGKIRVVIINGEPWFVAADVCRVLGLGDVSKAVKRLDKDEKSFATIPARGTNLIPTQGGEQQMLIVNEPGLYRLIFASRKPEARDFQRWVYHEVLPSIRKTGSYSVAEPAAKPAAERKPRKSCDIIVGHALVYVFLLSNGFVKIGCSGNPRTRAAEIERETGLTIERVYVSPFMPRRLARFVEWLCQKNFLKQRVTDEIFSVDFETACATIDAFATPETLQLIYKLNIATATVTAAEKSE